MTRMRDKGCVTNILSFLKHCDTLMSGQSLPEIIHKATLLIEDPIHWCGSHTACIHQRVSTSDGIPYLLDNACSINDPRATCLNVEGAVARACNDAGIVPPILSKALDQWTLDYLNERDVTMFGQEQSAWNPYTIGWFGEYYSHDEAMNLLHHIYGRVS